MAAGVSVVTTTYNERETTAALVLSVRKALGGTPHEVIVVDDSSEDGTYEIAAGLADRAVRKRREGQTRGLLAGMRLARFDTVVTIDADLENPPELIPELVRLAEMYDVVAASRTRLPRPVEVLAAETLGRLLGVHDVFSNFRAFRRSALGTLRADLGETFGAELLARARKAGFRVGEVMFVPPPRRSAPRIGGQLRANARASLALARTLLFYLSPGRKV